MIQSCPECELYCNEDVCLCKCHEQLNTINEIRTLIAKLMAEEATLPLKVRDTGWVALEILDQRIKDYYNL